MPDSNTPLSRVPVIGRVRLQDRPSWKIFVALAVVGFIALIAELLIVQDIERTQEYIIEQQLKNRETSYVNRAVDCVILVAFDIELPEDCKQPEVQRYYNADDVVRRSSSFKVEQVSNDGADMCCAVAE